MWCQSRCIGLAIGETPQASNRGFILDIDLIIGVRIFNNKTDAGRGRDGSPILNTVNDVEEQAASRRQSQPYHQSRTYEPEWAAARLAETKFCYHML